jgi:hypothetical protein
MQRCSKFNHCNGTRQINGVCLGDYDAMAMCPEWVLASATEKLITDLITKRQHDRHLPHPNPL